jgi:hypothetical protein
VRHWVICADCETTRYNRRNLLGSWVLSGAYRGSALTKLDGRTWGRRIRRAALVGSWAKNPIPAIEEIP